MASRSLERWRDERASAMDSLENAHGLITGRLRGRPRDTKELNHALFLRLAAEVQGFCRDLHDESIEALCDPAQVPSPEIRNAFRTAATTGRKVDSGNANPGSIGSDWALLGIGIWTELNAAYPSASTGAGDWNARLTWLNTARNGIAHNDPIKIGNAHADHPLTLHTFRVMRRRLTKFAVALDRQTGAYLRRATGIDPW